MSAGATGPAIVLFPHALAVLLVAAAVLAMPRRAALVTPRLPAPRTGPTGPGGRPVERAFWRAAAALPLLCGVAVGALAAVLVGGVQGLCCGVVTGGAAAFGAYRWSRGPAAEAATEPLRLAGAWDLLSACLRAGLPVSTAAAAVADQLPGADGGVLRRVADLLATGADPADAWEPALANPATAALAMAARRTAHSGAAMADAVSELAGQVRAAAADLAEERAQRAGVLITGPLGLCFLPAFFCLGVLPVVIGLARQLFQHW